MALQKLQSVSLSSSVKNSSLSFEEDNSKADIIFILILLLLRCLSRERKIKGSDSGK